MTQYEKEQELAKQWKRKFDRALNVAFVESYLYSETEFQNDKVNTEKFRDKLLLLKDQAENNALGHKPYYGYLKNLETSSPFDIGLYSDDERFVGLLYNIENTSDKQFERLFEGTEYKANIINAMKILRSEKVSGEKGIQHGQSSKKNKLNVGNEIDSIAYNLINSYELEKRQSRTVETPAPQTGLHIRN